MFSLGSWCFQFPTLYPRYGTLGFQPVSFWFVPRGLSPSLAGRFRPLWLGQLGGGWTLQHYISRQFLGEIRFGLFPFRSLLVGESRVWFLFLPLLRCFRSGGFRSVWERREGPKALATRSLIWVSTDLSLLAATRGISLLAAPFFGAQA